MNDSEKNKWYFNCVFYETRSEFEEAIKKHANSKISPESVDKMLGRMCADIKNNIPLLDEKKLITNEEFIKICWDCWFKFIEEFRRKVEESDSNPQNETRSECGCTSPISCVTSKGIKTMVPGKKYDENWDEIP